MVVLVRYVLSFVFRSFVVVFYRFAGEECNNTVPVPRPCGNELMPERVVLLCHPVGSNWACEGMANRYSPSQEATVQRDSMVWSPGSSVVGWRLLMVKDPLVLIRSAKTPPRTVAEPEALNLPVPAALWQ